MHAGLSSKAAPRGLNGTCMARPATDTERHRITISARMPSDLGLYIGAGEGPGRVLRRVMRDTSVSTGVRQSKRGLGRRVRAGFRSLAVLEGHAGLGLGGQRFVVGLHRRVVVVDARWGQVVPRRN